MKDGAPLPTGAPPSVSMRTGPVPPGPAGAGDSGLALPGAHFAVALTFWVAGALGLLWIAPLLASGAFMLPRIAAVTHLFTLGWITTSILGALYQFLPVALGVPIRSRAVAWSTLALYAPGVAALVGGLLTGAAAVTVAGAAALSAGLVLFAGNLSVTLRRSAERGLTWWCLAGATLFLLATVALGAALAANLRWPFLGSERLLALGVHVHVAVAGWVLLVVVGVAHRLLPMFLLSHGASTWPGRVAGICLSSGAGLLLVGHHWMSEGVHALVSALLAVGTLALVGQAAAFFRSRVRPRLDAGMRLAGTGMALLALCVPLGLWVGFRGVAATHATTAYGVALIAGALSLFVAGHYYKIVPFLVWFHRYGPEVGKGRPVPRVADLVAPKPAAAAAVLLPLGALGVAASAAVGAAVPAVVSAALYAGGSLLLARQMITLALRRST
jgi:hypothetical protein